uniref:Uncharacterized protein n=1 Tax=viral metagenome TaxID=1070528 RepID=A0A6M3JYX3_9ZZZZ
MAQNTKALTFEAGYIVVTEPNGSQTRYPIADILRAADIPTGLTYSQVQAITGLADILSVLIKELIEREVIEEAFLDGYELEDIVEQLDNAGGSYDKPDIGIDT